MAVLKEATVGLAASSPRLPLRFALGRFAGASRCWTTRSRAQPGKPTHEGFAEPDPGDRRDPCSPLAGFRMMVSWGWGCGGRRPRLTPTDRLRMDAGRPRIEPGQGSLGMLPSSSVRPSVVSTSIVIWNFSTVTGLDPRLRISMTSSPWTSTMAMALISPTADEPSEI